MWRSLALSCLLPITAITVAVVPAAAQVPEAELIATEWLGARHAAGQVEVRQPIFQGPGALFVEQQIAQRTIRRWWPARAGDARAGDILDGFSWYLQSRVIERVFDQRYLRPGHSAEALRYFGDHVIWSVPPVRLSRHAVATRDRYAAVFDSLERWIGVPDLQGAMFQVAQLPADRLTADVIVTTISSAAGQDLSWLFDAAESEVSYAVTGVNATSVTVIRKGAGVFSGRSAARMGDFESGDAVRVKVVFGSGETTLVTWDGRDPSRTFQFEGPSPVTAAYLDPERLITLDQNYLDNAIVTPTPTNVPVRKWVARWMVWLQHTMLSYGFLA
jgi:hypothetical protein